VAGNMAAKSLSLTTSMEKSIFLESTYFRERFGLALFDQSPFSEKKSYFN
jgi:hypothetical protein